jgi:DNA repair photolyase
MYKGKIIYNPSGKAGEYSYWAANFYNGCSGDCSYCYMKKPPMNQVWSVKPTLKKSCVSQNHAIEIFQKECFKNKTSLQKHGLFFNFNSDPFLKESFDLNMCCIEQANLMNIPCKVLTKQTWFVNDYFPKPEVETKHINFGFTLTGHDELEPGCGTNQSRIYAMRRLKFRGFKTWASIEPIVDLDSSLIMIMQSLKYCDHYKIGLMSGKKYDIEKLRLFISAVSMLKKKIYFKDSILKEAGVDREDLPSNCVNRDFC